MVKIIYSLGFMLLSCNLFAQFIGGLTVGFNASQINGDELAGFTKLGIHAGILGGYELTERTTLNVELLYSERGSRASIEEGLIGFRTNFIEIPVYLTYKDWLKDEYYKVSGGAGLIYSNLIRAEDIRFGETALTQAFNANDIAAMVQARLFIRENWSFDVRYTRSFTRLFNNTESNPNNNSLIGYHLTFRTAFIF